MTLSERTGNGLDGIGAVCLAPRAAGENIPHKEILAKLSLQEYLGVMPHEPARDTHIPGTAALRALAHPLRVEIYDLLTQYGPQTSSSLAEMTGESTGSTSYHLRALATHGLIEEDSERGTGRERWWKRAHRSLQIASPEALQTPAGLAASQVVNLEFLDRRHRQLRDTLTSALRGDPDEWDEHIYVTTATTGLTLAQLEELQAELQHTLDTYVEKYRDQQGEGVRRISIQVSTLPLPEK